MAKSCITSLPQSIATWALPGWTAGTSFAPIGEMPRNVMAVAIVFAVNWPPHAPAPGHARSSSSQTSFSVILPVA
ncbi:MAG: hypothetical protein ABSG27_02330 [Candidatus Acidiferrales bacterium]